MILTPWPYDTSGCALIGRGYDTRINFYTGLTYFELENVSLAAPGSRLALHVEPLDSTRFALTGSGCVTRALA